MGKSVIACALMAVTILSPFFNAKTVRCMTCKEAITTVIPCMPYLTAPPGAEPSGPCCDGLDKVNREATSPQARRDLCVCFQKAAKSYHVDPAKATNLPSLCGITVVVPIDPHLDCGSIQL